MGCTITFTTIKLVYIVYMKLGTKSFCNDQKIISTESKSVRFLGRVGTPALYDMYSLFCHSVEHCDAKMVSGLQQ